MSQGHVHGYVDPNFPNPMTANDAPIIIYGYRPSLALGVLGAVLFIIAAFGHSLMLFRYRTWYFSTIVVGTPMEVVGYIVRCLSSQNDPYSVPYFVVQYFFIIVAPVFFSAAIYTIITVMINRVGREYAPLPPKVILGIFITSDVVATVIQIVGSALIGVAYSGKKDPNTPNHILLAGLAFQVFSFALFVVCLTVFLWRTRNVTSSAFKAFSAALSLATIMVYLRTCIRLAESAEGLQHWLSTHEVIFGCLEFAPMVIAVYTLLYYHPGRWLGSKREPGKCFKEPSNKEIGESVEVSA